MPDETTPAAPQPPRPALPAQPAGKRPMHRKIKVTVRAPFLPAHHGHARHGLQGHHKGHPKR